MSLIMELPSEFFNNIGCFRVLESIGMELFFIFAGESQEEIEEKTKCSFAAARAMQIYMRVHLRPPLVSILGRLNKDESPRWDSVFSGLCAINPEISGHLFEVSGPAGSGKSQFLMSLGTDILVKNFSSIMQLMIDYSTEILSDPSDANFSEWEKCFSSSRRFFSELYRQCFGHLIWIDSEGTFCADRLIQILRSKIEEAGCFHAFSSWVCVFLENKPSEFKCCLDPKRPRVDSLDCTEKLGVFEDTHLESENHFRERWLRIVLDEIFGIDYHVCFEKPSNISEGHFLEKVSLRLLESVQIQRVVVDADYPDMGFSKILEGLRNMEVFEDARRTQRRDFFEALRSPTLREELNRSYDVYFPSLLVLDSIAAIFRGVETVPTQRQQMLCEIGYALKRISTRNGFMVITSNQIAAALGTDETDLAINTRARVRPCLGYCWSHIVDTRLWMGRCWVSTVETDVASRHSETLPAQQTVVGDIQNKMRILTSLKSGSAPIYEMMTVDEGGIKILINQTTSTGPLNKNIVPEHIVGSSLAPVLVEMDNETWVVEI